MKKAIQKGFNHFGFQLSRLGKPAPNAFTLQRNLIKTKQPVIFDVGAHQGRIAKEYRGLFPLASIYCFEPFSQSFQDLSTNLEDDSRTLCFEIALSDQVGTAILNANLSSATNSLLKTDKRGAFFWGEGLLDTTSQLEVSTSTIDTFCDQADIPHIDILKMDVQGSEFSVLLGGQNMLACNKVSIIYSELIMSPTYVGQYKLHDYLSFLDSLGYEFLDMFDPIRRNGQLIQADAIFLNSTFKKESESRLRDS